MRVEAKSAGEAVMEAGTGFSMAGGEESYDPLNLLFHRQLTPKQQKFPELVPDDPQSPVSAVEAIAQFLSGNLKSRSISGQGLITLLSPWEK